MTEQSRRVFLGHSARALGLAPAAWAGSTTAGPATAAGPNDRIRVGLIGCGGIGKHDLTVFLSNPEVDCPVICDIDDAQLAKGVALVEKLRGRRPDTVKDFRRVIDRQDVDVCLVATPDHWHAVPTVYACQSGKDVYVEKPLATSVGEGRVMMETARRGNRILQMGTQWRSGAHYAEAVEYVQSGKLGRVRQVRAWAYLDWVGGIGRPADGTPPAGVDYDMWLGPAPERPFNPNRFHFNFRWFWDYAGGLMTDWGVHLINVALWAMGLTPPRSVVSSGRKYVMDDNSETPDTQVAVYDFPRFQLIWEHQMGAGLGPGGRPHGLAFTGSDATLTLDSSGWEIAAEPKRRQIVARRTIDPKDPAADGRPAHIRNFLDSVRSRRQPVTNAEVGHMVSAVCHLGNLALRSGRPLSWDVSGAATSGTQPDPLTTRAYRQPWTLPGL